MLGRETDTYRTSTGVQLELLRAENDELRREMLRLTRASRRRLASRSTAFVVGAVCATVLISGAFIAQAGYFDFAPQPAVLLVDDIRPVRVDMSYPWCEPGGRRRCETGALGTCADGEQVCHPDVGWSPCASAGPAAEACDGVDNDCDGRTDEIRTCVCVPGDLRSCPVWEYDCGEDHRTLMVGYQYCDQEGSSWSPCGITIECAW